MTAPEYDLIVAGGGIHGCGTAQAAAAAGYSVLVVEQTALAHGTSSRSSKLIHGGLRYLEQYEFGLVRECLRERRLLLELAPDLVKLRPFHIPVYQDTSRPAWQVRLGLSVYAALAGFRRRARFTTVAERDWPGLDGLATEGLVNVFRYRDAQTDDRRLTRAVMASARSLGAALACPARVVGVELDGERVHATVEADGRARRVTARALVNATGPWVNELLSRTTPAPPQRAVELVRGTHVEIAGSLSRGIYYTEAPADRRPVFVMPWGNNTLVGTTEAPFSGDPATVAPTEAEVAYLEAVVRRYFPERRWREIDRFAGLRVLPAGPDPANRRSRETLLHPDRPRQPRLLSIYGGKLTSYRHTAERVIGRLRPGLPDRRRRARTDRLPLAPDDA